MGTFRTCTGHRVHAPRDLGTGGRAGQSPGIVRGIVPGDPARDRPSGPWRSPAIRERLPGTRRPQDRRYRPAAMCASATWSGAFFLDFLEDHLGSNVALDFRDVGVEMRAHTELLGDGGDERRQPCDLMLRQQTDLKIEVGALVR